MKSLKLFGIAFFLFISFQSFAQNEWIIPEKHVYTVNPTMEADFLMLGKDLYTKYCKSCHGDEGYGDGNSAAKLGGGVCDFSIDKFQTQPDGVIFYKITFGRTNMPNHSKQLPNDIDRWLLVNYIRTLSEAEKSEIMIK
jgi:mono/diheme cytochrome c family protein